jgi:hypothetical protein
MHGDSDDLPDIITERSVLSRASCRLLVDTRGLE